MSRPEVTALIQEMQVLLLTMELAYASGVPMDSWEWRLEYARRTLTGLLQAEASGDTRSAPLVEAWRTWVKRLGADGLENTQE